MCKQVFNVSNDQQYHPALWQVAAILCGQFQRHKEPLIKSLMERVCLQLLMIARRIPQAHAVAYTSRDATQQAQQLQQTVVYSTEGRKKRCANVVAALDNTTSIICALRLSFISIFSPSRPSWT